MVLHGKIRYNLSLPKCIITSKMKQLTFAEQQNWTDWLCQIKGILFSLENLFWKLKYYQHVHFRKYFVDVFDTSPWKLRGFILHMMGCISFYSQVRGYNEQHLPVVSQPPWSNLLQEPFWADVRLSAPQGECPFSRTNSVSGCWVTGSSPIGCLHPACGYELTLSSSQSWVTMSPITHPFMNLQLSCLKVSVTDLSTVLWKSQEQCAGVTLCISCPHSQASWLGLVLVWI